MLGTDRNNMLESCYAPGCDLQRPADMEWLVHEPGVGG